MVMETDTVTAVGEEENNAITWYGNQFRKCVKYENFRRNETNE